MKPQEPIDERSKTNPSMADKKAGCGCGSGVKADADANAKDDADFAEGSNVKSDKAQKNPGYPRREAEEAADKDSLH